jgi:hypothetical protein
MIGVEVSFWGEKIYPVRFMLNGRRYEIKRVVIRFERKDGGREFLCFGVDTGGAMAELRMDKRNFEWKIFSMESI